MQKLFNIFALMMLTCTLQAQELNCEVNVTFENVTQTDPTVFRNLEQKIQAFLNETKWTNNDFDTEERINCTINLNILSEVNQNSYRAQATIKSTRPVYNSTYETIVLDVIDNDFEFEYDPFVVIQYRENQFVDNLSASLAFYALTIIGLDYDTFSQNGGLKYHREAAQLVNQGAATQFPGWTQANSNNRGDVSKYWISQNLTENRFFNFKREFYNYHRQVLDILYDEPQDAWNNMENMLNRLEQFHKQNRNLQILYIFFDAKAEEIVNVMEKATPSQKQTVAEKCEVMDPLNTKLYRTLIK